jgi:two-component system, chemotaxis family, CheB/CheR fusion protein
VRLRNEFVVHAEAQGLKLVVVPCSLLVRSDPHLVEQMLRNLLSNALKYTKTGRILIGCRRKAGHVSIEVWDTGVGIVTTELSAIFDEYHQLDNAARERARGLGLGLAIVRRLANLLGVGIHVRSQLGKGSAFTISLPSGARRGNSPVTPSAPPKLGRPRDDAPTALANPAGPILVVEDDPDVRDLLALFLTDEGYDVQTASDGPAAMTLLAKGRIRPSVMLIDFNLPKGTNGVELANAARLKLGHRVATVILTGDVSDETKALISDAGCTRLSKPMQLTELASVIAGFMVTASSSVKTDVHHSSDQGAGRKSVVYIVDDDTRLREALRSVLEDGGYNVEDFSEGELFLTTYQFNGADCLLLDAHMPSMSGLQVLRRLGETGHPLPTIMITGNSDVPIAVEAMKAGAYDFIEKPVGARELLESVERALNRSRGSATTLAWQAQAARQIGALSTRERQIMDFVLAGHPSKIIAADLGISQRTVENHRAAIMIKTGSKSLPDLVRLAIAFETAVV